MILMEANGSIYMIHMILCTTGQAGFSIRGIHRLSTSCTVDRFLPLVA